MTGFEIRLPLLLLTALMMVQSAGATQADNPQADDETPSSQQDGMQENLEDAIPASDQAEEQDHGLKNPRIVVPENLKEMPQLKAVTADDRAGEDTGQEGPLETVVEEAQQELKEDLKKVQDSEGGAATNRPELLDRTDKIMDLSRLPLTYVQEHVPFLTKRKIIFFGRLELDYSHYSSGVLEDDSGLEVRRFRLGLAGRVVFWPKWNYKLEVDLGDSTSTLSDAYLSYYSSRWGTFRIGNQKVAQTLSGQTSSLSIPFMERPLPVLAFTLSRRLGLGYDVHLKKLGANVTIFGQDPNQDIGSHGYAARFYYNPTRSHFHVLHVGASFMQLSTDQDAEFDAKPESDKTDIRLVDTGVFPDVGTGSTLGLELAGAKGPVTFRSEFYRADWSRSNDTNPQFSGWYAEASWFLTGEHANYRDGKFIRPIIDSDRGAWEVAVRFSTLDLNDLDVEGGTEDNLSLGVNWYSKTHWRFMGNLIKVNADDGPYGDQNPWIIQFRAQYYF